jgi:hypothetical protein
VNPSRKCSNRSWRFGHCGVAPTRSSLPFDLFSERTAHSSRRCTKHHRGSQGIVWPDEAFICVTDPYGCARSGTPRTRSQCPSCTTAVSAVPLSPGGTRPLAHRTAPDSPEAATGGSPGVGSNFRSGCDG